MRRLVLSASSIVSLVLTACTGEVGTDTAEFRSDHRRPSQPGSFQAVGASSDSISVTWNASTDNVGVTGYQLDRDGVDDGTTAELGWTFAGLACETSYLVSVRAVDGAGNQSSAASLTASTGPCGDGAPGAFTAQYFASVDLSGPPALTAIEPAPLAHHWGQGGPAGLPVDDFSARWEGDFDVPAGDTRFTVTADDGVRVWVDGAILIDHWIDQAATTYSAQLTLAAGTHHVRIEYYEHTGGAILDASWAPAGSGGGGGSPSGEPMPVGDLPGWRQVFADDFTQDVPVGSFPDAVSGRWAAYPYPWKGTPTWATYDPHRTTSFHDGMQDIWIHTDPGSHEHLIAANEPKMATGDPMSQLYGRYVIRYKADKFAYYHASWLLWPKSEVWPRDGEIDFPEADFDSSAISAFMHRQDGTSGGDQDGYRANVAMGGSGWHTAVIEWLPTRCTFLLDGVKIGEATSRIPNTPMRYVIQNGGSFATSVAPDSVQGHIYIDWVAIYARQ